MDGAGDRGWGKAEGGGVGEGDDNKGKEAKVGGKGGEGGGDGRWWQGRESEGGEGSNG